MWLSSVAVRLPILSSYSPRRRDENTGKPPPSPPQTQPRVRVKLKVKEEEGNNKSSSSSSRVGFGGKKRGEQLWQCVEGCGACCKLQKGPSFATPEEIFTDPADIQLYRSLIGPDGWCIHYDKPTRKCSIYPDRPYFCRVEADVFQSLYGIPNKKFNKEACNSCRDTIKCIYGPHSKELDHFNRSVTQTIQR